MLVGSAAGCVSPACQAMGHSCAAISLNLCHWCLPPFHSMPLHTCPWSLLSKVPIELWLRWVQCKFKAAWHQLCWIYPAEIKKSTLWWSGSACHGSGCVEPSFTFTVSKDICVLWDYEMWSSNGGPLWVYSGPPCTNRPRIHNLQYDQ